MTQLITHRASAFAGTTGAMFYLKYIAGVATKVVMTLPASVGATAIRPYFAGIGKRTIVAGAWSEPLIVCEDNTVNRLGIKAPDVATYDAANNPNGLRMQTAAGASSGGTYIGYITFAHKIGSTIVAESSLSAETPPLVTTSVQSRAWSGIPTTSPNPRVTHVRGYLSVAGGDPKFAWERTIGLSTITESVLDGQLLEEGSTRRDVPPSATLLEVYHRRVWYNHPGFPERLYFSEPNEPESVDSTNFLPTKDGEPITALRVVRDQLLVFCPSACYVVRGWDADDIQMEKVSPVIGTEASHSVVVVDDWCIFHTPEGWYATDGQSFRPIMEHSLADFWKAAYVAAPEVYRDTYAIVDRSTRTVLQLIPQTTGFRYVGFYPPLTAYGEAEPWYGFDGRNRKDYTMGLLGGVLHTGSTDGYIREENVALDDDDDGDTFAKQANIRSRHEFPDEGGMEHLGVRWVGVDAFIKCEGSPYTIRMFAGEEYAHDAEDPDYEYEVPAGAATGYVSKSRTHVKPPKVSGQGVTAAFVFDECTVMHFNGYGLEWAPGGSQARSPTT